MARVASLGRIKCKEHEETHKITKGLCGIINTELSMNFIIVVLSEFYTNFWFANKESGGLLMKL